MTSLIFLTPMVPKLHNDHPLTKLTKLAMRWWGSNQNMVASKLDGDHRIVMNLGGWCWMMLDGYKSNILKKGSQGLTWIDMDSCWNHDPTSGLSQVPGHARLAPKIACVQFVSWDDLGSYNSPWIIVPTYRQCGHHHRHRRRHHRQPDSGCQHLSASLHC